MEIIYKEKDRFTGIEKIKCLKSCCKTYKKALEVFNRMELNKIDIAILTLKEIRD